MSLFPFRWAQGPAGHRGNRCWCRSLGAFDWTVPPSLFVEDSELPGHLAPADLHMLRSRCQRSGDGGSVCVQTRLADHPAFTAQNGGLKGTLNFFPLEFSVFCARNDMLKCSLRMQSTSKGL